MSMKPYKDYTRLRQLRCWEAGLEGSEGREYIAVDLVEKSSIFVTQEDFLNRMAPFECWFVWEAGVVQGRSGSVLGVIALLA